ncbi:hypothetical protein GCM10022252_71160 [Streptosporangium oxazolinicum]|uniref:Uncharacterized protein n=1 Tax=Streptosporangium oxazolinicum TaxID=909287 RepID=A0ABP8BIE8_9ACTN
MTGTAPVARAVRERSIARVVRERPVVRAVREQRVVRERREIATRAVRWAVTHDGGGVTTGWIAEVATPPTPPTSSAVGTVWREPVRRA